MSAVFIGSPLACMSRRVGGTDCRGRSAVAFPDYRPVERISSRAMVWSPALSSACSVQSNQALAPSRNTAPPGCSVQRHPCESVTGLARQAKTCVTMTVGKHADAQVSAGPATAARWSSVCLDADGHKRRNQRHGGERTRRHPDRFAVDGRADGDHAGREAAERPPQFGFIRRVGGPSWNMSRRPLNRSPRRKSSSSRLVSLGASCWIQWPTSAIMWVPR